MRFVDLCDTFQIPVLNLVDNPGFLIGRKAEEGRHCATGQSRPDGLLPGFNTLGLCHSASLLWCRWRRARQCRPTQPTLCLAFR